MQTDQAASTVHGRHTTTTTISSTFKSQLHPDGVLYSSLDSPIFPTRHSFSRIPYSESGLPDSNFVSNHPYQSRSIQAHQEIVNRHSLCLTHLREATMEAETLRRENTSLRAMNHELNKHLSLLIQLGSSSTDDTAPFELLRAFHGLSIEDRGSAAWDDVADGSPTSVIGSGQNIEVERGRFTLPKSISVRSNGYLKTAGQASGRAGGTTRIGTASPPNITT